MQLEQMIDCPSFANASRNPKLGWLELACAIRSKSVHNIPEYLEYEHVLHTKQTFDIFFFPPHKSTASQIITSSAKILNT